MEAKEGLLADLKQALAHS
ncbi:MAG: hypothetical protein MR028_01910 [Ligilactobacillus agilis]|nr:hypothetical protein [Ligilactobacillus agilis]MCI5761164.1 hypothetical protein [Ligilactobacillus agilis]